MRLGGLGGVASAQQVRPVMPGPEAARYLARAGNTAGCSEVSGPSDLYQEGSRRRQSQWEAQESNSPGGFPRRRKDLGHWDLVTGQAGTLRALGRTQN